MLSVVVVAATAGCQTPIRESLVGVPSPPSLRLAFEQARGARGTSGVVLLEDPAEAWAARWQLLQQAHSSIQASYFIVDNDVFGLAFLGHLYRRAMNGVDVQLLLDGRGSIALATPLLGRDLLQELAATGHVDVRIFNPPLRQLLRSLSELNAVPISASTHQKLLVVDGAHAITGGRNISRTYFARFEEEPAAVADADVWMDDPAMVRAVTTAMSREFPFSGRDRIEADAVNVVSGRELLLMVYGAMDAWLTGAIAPAPLDDEVLFLEAAALAQLDALPSRQVRQTARELFREIAGLPSLRGSLPRHPADRHAAEVRVVCSLSRAMKNDDAANDALVRAIGGASQNILLESPYLILTPRVMRALQQASLRGVAISILTNSALSSDNPPSQALFIDTWPELEALIPTLRIHVTSSRRMLHAKRAVFDDDLTMIGTYNLDPFSAHVNSEILLSVWSRSFNAQNRARMTATREQEQMLEYRIARDDEQRAIRRPQGDPRAGEVEVAFGPRDHLPREQIERLLVLKTFLLSVRALWDFTVFVF